MNSSTHGKALWMLSLIKRTMKVIQMTNWEKYFETPEKLAKIMPRLTNAYMSNSCPVHLLGGRSCFECNLENGCVGATIEWLQEEAL